MEKETWKKLPEFEDYEVSDLGNIRRITPSRGTRPMRIVRPCSDRTGRLVFNARKNGKTKQWKVHRAVMAAFCGNCPPEREVAHLDGNQKNNKLTNLIYATPKENNQHKVLHGTQPKGSKIWCAKLTENDVIKIRQMSPQISYSKIAKEFGVSPISISQIFRKKTWKHV
jgi:hypothetical protein